MTVTTSVNPAGAGYITRVLEGNAYKYTMVPYSGYQPSHWHVVLDGVPTDYQSSYIYADRYLVEGTEHVVSLTAVFTYTGGGGGGAFDMTTMMGMIMALMMLGVVGGIAFTKKK